MEPIQREIDLLKISNNEFVLKYLDSFYLESTVGKVYFLVTQFYSDGTLHHLISRKCAINDPFHPNTIIKNSKQLFSRNECFVLHKLTRNDGSFLIQIESKSEQQISRN